MDEIQNIEILGLKIDSYLEKIKEYIPVLEKKNIFMEKVILNNELKNILLNQYLDIPFLVTDSFKPILKKYFLNSLYKFLFQIINKVLVIETRCQKSIFYKLGDNINYKNKIYKIYEKNILISHEELLVHLKCKEMFDINNEYMINTKNNLIGEIEIIFEKQINNLEEKRDQKLIDNIFIEKKGESFRIKIIPARKKNKIEITTTVE